MQNRPTIKDYRRGRIASGLFLVLIGVLIFARKMGVLLPEWLLTWPMFIIGLGIVTGVKHNFQNAGWFILTAIGVFFMVDDFFPEVDFWEFIFPGMLILIGVVLMFKPFRGWRHKHWKEGNHECMELSETSENRIEVNAIMGGVKKMVLSKDFKGGEINCIMGGAEINLTQADIHEKISLEINNIFGGTKLLVPANWVVISEVTVVMGGVEDKRPVPSNQERTEEKILVIKGSCVFGGMEIKSY